jgi:hypothetical protein
MLVEKKVKRKARAGRRRRRPRCGSIPDAILHRHAENPAWADPKAGFSENSVDQQEKSYFLERLDALSGLIFCVFSAMLVLTWVARLQLPFFHLIVGSGQAEQYQPDVTSRVRLHPLQFSTISWHTPPLYPQPLAVMKPHSIPSRTVVHFIITTSNKI